MYLRKCAPSEDSDQTERMRSLIRIFTECILDSQDAKFLHADIEDSNQSVQRRCKKVDFRRFGSYQNSNYFLSLTNSHKKDGKFTSNLLHKHRMRCERIHVGTMLTQIRILLGSNPIAVYTVFHCKIHNNMRQCTTKPAIRRVRRENKISLRIRAVWSESSLISCAFYSLRVILWGLKEKPCYTGWMYSLIWVFPGHTGLSVGFVARWLIYYE